MRRPRHLLRTVGLLVLAAALPTNLGASELGPCTGALAYLQGETAALPFAGPVQVGLRTELYMRKTDGQSGLYGDWMSTRMIQTSTFSPPLPNIPGGLEAPDFTIPGPDGGMECTSYWQVPNTVVVSECVGTTRYQVTAAGIFNVDAQTMTGRVIDGNFELDLYFGEPSFPMLTGTPWSPSDRGTIGLGARAVSESEGNRQWVRLIVAWSTTPPDFIAEVAVTHELDRVAGEIGLTHNIAGIQELATGQRQFVADFVNLTQLPDEILDAEITATVDWGQCEATTTRSVREMLPFGLP